MIRRIIGAPVEFRRVGRVADKTAVRLSQNDVARDVGPEGVRDEVPDKSAPQHDPQDHRSAGYSFGELAEWLTRQP